MMKRLAPKQHDAMKTIYEGMEEKIRNLSRRVLDRLDNIGYITISETPYPTPLGVEYCKKYFMGGK